MTKEIIQVQANSPEINEAKKPYDKIVKLWLSKCISPFIKSLAILPRINGITIKNEKRAAFDLSLPNKTEVDIVAPEREIPGSIAIAWEIPIITALV